MLNSPRSLDAITKHYTRLIDTLCELSESYYYLGRLDDALNLLDLGTQFLEAKEVTRRNRAKLLLQHGKILATSIFHNNRGYDKALPTLFQAKQIAESIPDEQLLANSLDLIGQVYYYTKLNTDEGNSSTSMTYFQQALEKREAIYDERGVSEALFHIGLIYENGDSPDNDKAEEYYTKALHLADQYNYKLEKSYAVRHLGFRSFEKGDLDTARKYLTESLTLREELEIQLLLPFSHMAVGDVLYTQKDMATALMHYQKAYTLAEEMDLKVATVMSILCIGDVRQAQGVLSEALEYFEKAYTISKASDIKLGVARASSRIEGISKQQEH